MPARAPTSGRLLITPDGVRRPVAVSIVTFLLALTGKVIIKDLMTREGAPGYAKRGRHMGVGLVGRTFGALGIGNIGAEAFRLLKPFDMKFIAHDPYADEKVAAELGIELVGLEDVFRRSDFLSVSVPFSNSTYHPGQRRALGDDEANSISDQHPRADRLSTSRQSLRPSRSARSPVPASMCWKKVRPHRTTPS